MTPAERSEVVMRHARDAGFEAAGIAPAGSIARGGDYLSNWLAQGLAGEMEYLARWRDIRANPQRLLEGAKSVIVVAHQYKQPSPPSQAQPPKPRQARVAQYAWGRDYHKLIRKKLHRLVRQLRDELREPFEARVCVDTAPVLERELAAAAGIGWIGKNTMVLNQHLGSFFFLGEVVTTLELAPSSPAADHCGSCTRCLEACPTGALIAPHQMDARKCISYLTIEHRSDIAEELRPAVGDWLYGCDICQDVCPFNRKAPPTGEPGYAPSEAPPASDPCEVLTWTEDEYLSKLAGSAMKRASLSMLQRNARIVLENAAAEPRP